MTNKTGFLNVLKPTGMTSADVVFAVKKLLKPSKIGHLGTLDPAATGVLPIALGKATKFFDYFLNKDKVYVARVKFSIETDTLDSFGNITNKNNIITKESDILKVLPRFIGKIFQTPPKFSAIKIGGKRACDLAREGKEVEIRPKQIEVFDIKLLKAVGENEFLFRVHCSAGTYIRTLFADIAAAAGTISTTTAILRTKSGRFENASAICLKEVTEEKIMTIEQVFNDYKFITVDDALAKKFLNGVKVFSSEIDTVGAAEFFVCHGNILIGLYASKNGNIEPLIFLNEVKND